MQEFARAVRLPVVNTAMCQRTYGGRHFNNRLCAGARLREIGICKVSTSMVQNISKIRNRGYW